MVGLNTNFMENSISNYTIHIFHETINPAIKLICLALQ